MELHKVSKETFKQIDEVVLMLESLFQNRILGIYLYGSAINGGLRPNSDIDILVVINKSISLAARESLTKQLFKFSGKVGNKEKRPLEVTVINHKDLISWQFPPKCEYMYGEWLRADIVAGKIPQAMYDPDLVVLLSQARKCSLTLQGTECSNIIPLISFHEIKKAIGSSLPQLISSFRGDEINAILTLSRMWLTLQTEDIVAKDIAAKWVLLKLPVRYQSLLQTAKEAYVGNVAYEWNYSEKETLALIEYMKLQIEKLL